MSRIEQEQEVMQLASELGLDWRNPVTEIVNYCLAKIQKWVNDDGPISTLAHLEEIVCKHLKLQVEEVWSDDDLTSIIRKYVHLGDPVFAALRSDLDHSTFAALLKRGQITPNDQHHYVAVIDCRGEKAHRRFFTRWHEIAHLLTLVRDLEFPFHRSSVEQSPTERLMDVIAGIIGFYDPIFQPAVEAEIDAFNSLTFAGVERIRNSLCPNASFMATLAACVDRASIPLVCVHAGMGYKKVEEAQLNSDQLELFPMDKPIPKLRALVAIRNDAAKTSDLRIDPNMQVPDESLVASYYHATDGQSTAVDTAGRENLEIWRHSDGMSVSTTMVDVEVRRSGDRVIALIRAAIDNGPRCLKNV